MSARWQGFCLHNRCRTKVMPILWWEKFCDICAVIATLQMCTGPTLNKAHPSFHIGYTTHVPFL